MNTIQISNLFHTLGISPNYRGYSFLLYLIELAATYKGQPFPRMKDLYRQTADHFGVTTNIVEYNIRTVIRLYWNQTDSVKNFSAAVHYPVSESLSVKEFVSIIAEYVAFHPCV